MGNSKIDTIIQYKLSDHKTPLDKESLWAAIESDVVTSSSTSGTGSAVTDSAVRPTGTFRKILPLLLITAAIGFTSMYLLTEDETAPVNNQETVSQLIANTEATTTQQFESKSNKEEATTTESNETISQVANATIIEEPAQTKTTVTPIQYNESNQVIETKSNIQKEIANQVVQNESSTIVSESTVRQARKTPSSAIVNRSSTESNGIAHTNLLGLDKLASHNLSFDYFEPSVAISDKYLSPVKDKISCYNYAPSKLNISAYLYYGPGASLRSLKANGGEMMENLVNERENSEVVLENHRAGLQLKATTNSGIYFKAGIERSVINEKFMQFSTDTTMEIRQVVVEITQYPDGSTEEVYGDQEVTIISRKEWKKYNQFKTFDLTAIVGYESNLRKWKYAIEGGIIYNFNTQFDGTILDEVSLQPTGDTSRFFKSETGIDLHLAGGLGYDIGSSMTLWATPSIRFDLNNINEATYKVDQSYQMANLLLGLEYRF